MLPKVNVSRWLMTTHKARILSSFPEMAIYQDLKSLEFTLDEIYQKRWLQFQAGKLYKLAMTDSPYERYIRTIAGPTNSPKMHCLDLTMSPASALVVYWVSRSPFSGVGSEFFANVDHRLFASYGRNQLP